MKTDNKADIFSARKNKKRESDGHWIGPNGEDGGVTGEKTRYKVDEILYNSYDSMDEAIKELTAEVCLKHVNAQVATNAKNAARAAAVGVVSDTAIRQTATVELLSTPEGQAMLLAANGDSARINAIIEGRMEQIKARLGVVDETTEPAVTA